MAFGSFSKYMFAVWIFSKIMVNYNFIFIITLFLFKALGYEYRMMQRTDILLNSFKELTVQHICIGSVPTYFECNLSGLGVSAQDADYPADSRVILFPIFMWSHNLIVCPSYLSVSIFK